MKASDVMNEQVKWLKDRCKILKKRVDENAPRSIWDTDLYYHELKSKLAECVAIKVSTEKYMKKLRHEGN